LTRRRGVATLWMHFFWIFGEPRKFTIPGDSRVCVCVEIQSRCFAQTDFWATRVDWWRRARLAAGLSGMDSVLGLIHIVTIGIDSAANHLFG